MRLKNYLRKLLVLSIGLYSNSYNMYALSSHERLAQEAVINYYTYLQEYAQNPGNFELNKKVKSLFDNGGNVVFNDLYEIENGLIDQNQESDIDGYMATIMNLWARNDQLLKITGKIDLSSFVEENDPDFKEIGLKVVWLTATKSISVSGHPIDDVKETFKIKDGKIQTISTPERSTAIIDALRYYNRGDFEKAYYGFMQQINNSTADDDTYFYLGLMFRKGKDICKKLFPSKDLRDKLCAFYWMKSKRGLKACYYYGIHTYYHLDYNRINNPFQCGLMTVYKGDGESYGYMNEKGKMVIPYIFKKAYSFSEKDRLALVQSRDDKWGIINTEGKYVISPEYRDFKLFSSGVYAVRGLLKWGLVDINGNLVLSPQFDDIRPVQDGLAAFNEGKKWGFIDINGKVVIAAQYDKVLDFKSGLAAVVQDGKVGFIDKENKIIVPLIYDNATSFVPKMGVAAVKKNKKWGVVDRTGSIILNVIYDKLELEDNNGIIIVYDGDKPQKKPLKDLKQSKTEIDKTKYLTH